MWEQIKAGAKVEWEDDDAESDEDDTESDEDHMKVSRTPTPFHASPLILIPSTFT